MKDRIELRFTVATDEIKGTAAKAIAVVINKGLKKIEPQIMKIVDAATSELEKEIKSTEE